MIASSVDSTIAESLSCSCSACLRWEISRKTSTAPVILPSLSFIGAPLSSIGTSVPSLRTRIVWFAKPIIMPFLSTLATGSSTSFTGVLIDYVEYFLYPFLRSLKKFPTCQFFSHSIHEDDFALSIASDDSVTDTLQCGCPTFAHFSLTHLLLFCVHQKEQHSPMKWLPAKLASQSCQSFQA